MMQLLKINSSPSRTDVINELKNLKVSNGATGEIQFDSNGNRKDPSKMFLRVVACKTDKGKLDFVPDNDKNAASAGLPCQTSTKPSDRP